YLDVAPDAANRSSAAALLAKLGDDSAQTPVREVAAATSGLADAVDDENPLDGSRAVHAAPPRVADRPQAGTSGWRSAFWKWGPAAAAAVALTTSALMLSRASDQADAIARTLPQQGASPTFTYNDNIRALEDGYSANRTWGLVALAGGGALAGLSAFLFFSDSKDGARAARAYVVP